MDLSMIRSQPPGSDVHGLLERVAYRFYSKNRYCTEKPEENWFLAESAINFAKSRWPHIFESPEAYHIALEWTADGLKTRGGLDQNITWYTIDQDTAWYKAQDYWADQLTTLDEIVRIAA